MLGKFDLSIIDMIFMVVLFILFESIYFYSIGIPYFDILNNRKLVKKVTNKNIIIDKDDLEYFNLLLQIDYANKNIDFETYIKLNRKLQGRLMLYDEIELNI